MPKANGVWISTILLGILLTSSNVWGQNSDAERFREQFKSESFSIGALLQTTGEYQPERIAGTGANGFSVSNARFQIFGEVDEFGYQLQANMIRNPSVLDANIYYNLASDISVKAGLFKSPFSGELLRSAAALDFIRRSTAVNQLAPSRQIGLQLEGSLSQNRFRYKFGIFNGNGFDENQNNDGQFLYAGRMESVVATGGEESNAMVWGINASYEQKDVSSSSGNLRSTLEGEQLLLGSDVRIEHNSIMLSSEVIYARMHSDFAGEINPFGYQITGRYKVSTDTQLLLRWDRFEDDMISRTADAEHLMAGINFFPSSIFKIQLNYIYPVDREVEFSQIFIRVQLNL